MPNSDKTSGSSPAPTVNQWKMLAVTLKRDIFDVVVFEEQCDTKKLTMDPYVCVCVSESLIVCE